MAFYNGLPSLTPAENNLDGFGTADVALIKQSLLNVLHTRKGSRLMDPDYGTELHRLIYERNMSIVHASAVKEIQEAINKYEPRVEILEIGTGNSGPLKDIIVINVSVNYIEFDITELIQLNYNVDITS